MSESFLDAYLQTKRRVYPEKLSSSDDDIFQYAVSEEEDIEVLHELEAMLSAELTGILIEIRRTKRSFPGKIFGAKKMVEKEKRHEKAISRVGERIREIEQCSW